VRENDPGDSFYLIRSGIAAVVKGDLDAPTILGFRMAGGMIGEMALLEDQPRSATVVALEETVLWRMSRDAFLRFPAITPVSLSTNARAQLAPAQIDTERSQEVETGNSASSAAPFP